MIHFPDLTLKGTTYRLKELTIGESIAIAAMPGHREESNVTAMVKAVASHSDGTPVDPLSLTAEERLAIMAHYMVCTLDDGPDFAMGSDGARYSDYVDFSLGSDEPVDPAEIGDVKGDRWSLAPLTGLSLESIERLQGQVGDLSGRSHWIICSMAAQLYREGESIPGDPDAMDAWIKQRGQVFAAYPGSDFSTLFIRWAQCRAERRYLYRIDFSADGIVVAPRSGGAASALARFPIHSAITPVARLLG